MEVTSLCIFNLLSVLLSKTRFHEVFINPTPYLEMGYFLPFYTENAACIYGLIFFLPADISFICVVYS